MFTALVHVISTVLVHFISTVLVIVISAVLVIVICTVIVTVSFNQLWTEKESSPRHILQRRWQAIWLNIVPRHVSSTLHHCSNLCRMQMDNSCRKLANVIDSKRGRRYLVYGYWIHILQHLHIQCNTA